ncbi:DMT family transporter [Labilibaculum sp. DW002]|uniref:DMT family transporter n=1 Tax=Paralabilibaculum antarcticum TaxID=2912572 RepID=A0ABT5VSN5_9BACT|nr:DMT family transporter [Labilibaculum sp. DW002]MDE5418306.1 DMT family transporter [Labilibaculum sp. DW002]
MIKPSKLKGSLLALLATISFSNVYIFSKLAMKDISLPSFGLLWFGLALFYNLLYYTFFSEKKKISQLPKKSKSTLIFIGLSELISISAFFLSIQLTENPSIVSFLANTSPIFVIILGFFFLKTRYNLLAVIGIVITLSGVLLINYTSSGFNLNNFLQPSSIAALVFALFYGISLLLARQQIKSLPPAMVTVCRTFFLFIGFGLYNIASWQIPQYSLNSLFYIGIGSILGPFMGISLTFASLKYVDASITTLIGTSRSFFIILGAFLFMSILPTTNQLLGGLLTIIGIVLITMEDIKKRS